jgi:hypothetical protein
MVQKWFLGVAIGLLVIGNPLAKGEPAEPEPLGPPRAVAPAPRVLYYSYPRVSRYEVWQNYGVDRYGRFRPLVIYGPYGAYYRYNHEPYPWTATHNWEFMPYVVDSPSGQ